LLHLDTLNETMKYSGGAEGLRERQRLQINSCF